VLRADFVYANPRAELAHAVESGEAPDTGLLGQNHLHEFGIDARVHDSRLRRRRRLPGVAHRATWVAREVAMPWEAGNADVVVTPLASLLPLIARARRRPKTVVLNISLCTTLRRIGGARRRFLEASLRSAHAIVCLAAAQRDLLLRQVRLDPARVHVALLGVDAQFYAPSPASGDGVLAVGRDLGRDYATFAAAMRRLDAPATIVASTKNLVGVDLPANVVVALDVPPRRLRDLYAEAACVVVPTRAGEFDRGADCSGQTVLLDAAASARATVVTRRATLAEYVDDGVTALAVEAEDPAGLADAISRLLDDEAERRALANEGRALVERAHTTRHFAERLAPIIREACAS
jgi:glycosyltransferase involved in cell wall biosynthesis